MIVIKYYIGSQMGKGFCLGSSIRSSNPSHSQAFLSDLGYLVLIHFVASFAIGEFCRCYNFTIRY